jgi:hypothetical protein
VNPDGSVMMNSKRGLPSRQLFVYFPPEWNLAFVILLRDFFSRFLSFSHKDNDSQSLTLP